MRKAVAHLVFEVELPAKEEDRERSELVDGEWVKRTFKHAAIDESLLSKDLRGKEFDLSASEPAKSEA